MRNQFSRAQVIARHTGKPLGSVSELSVAGMRLWNGTDDSAFPNANRFVPAGWSLVVSIDDPTAVYCVSQQEANEAGLANSS
jgi:hypothetical protein